MTTDANDLEVMAKERPNECFLKGSGVLKLLGAIRTLEREVAALKAQPAPTEAQGGRLLELFKHTLGSLAMHDSAEAERIGKLYRQAQSSGNSGELQPSGNTGELAQGEDSARLVGGYIGAVITAQHGRAAKLALLYDTEGQAIAASEFIGELVARASAETGGVKS